MSGSRGRQSAFRHQLAVGASLAVLAGASGAAAQAVEPATPADVGEVVVTGSRIVRDGFEAPTPVTVVARNSSPPPRPAAFPTR